MDKSCTLIKNNELQALYTKISDLENINSKLSREKTEIIRTWTDKVALAESQSKPDVLEVRIAFKEYVQEEAPSYFRSCGDSCYLRDITEIPNFKDNINISDGLKKQIKNIIQKISEGIESRVKSDHEHNLKTEVNKQSKKAYSDGFADAQEVILKKSLFGRFKKSTVKALEKHAAIKIKEWKN